jgi:hypothetical protein
MLEFVLDFPLVTRLERPLVALLEFELGHWKDYRMELRWAMH